MTSIIDHFNPSLGPGPAQKWPPHAPTSMAGVGLGRPPPSSQPSTHAPYPSAGPSSTNIPLLPVSHIVLINRWVADDLDMHNVPPELEEECSDWFTVFNPKVKRVLGVNLVHTLMHEWYVMERFEGLRKSDYRVFSQRRLQRPVLRLMVSIRPQDVIGLPKSTTLRLERKPAQIAIVNSQTSVS
jgi:hypothetical protein